MKNILKIIILIITTFLFSFTYAAEEPANWNKNNENKVEDIQVKVTEYIPWAWCDKIPKDWIYTCTMTPWFWTIQSMIWWIIKWFTAIAALSWVLFIVVNWMMLSMWWWNKDDAKKHITKTIIWLILLLLSWAILYMLFPWIYV